MTRCEAKNILTCKWIFKVKEKMGENGKLTKFDKARLCARGFRQVEGVDYGDTFLML